jgi:beta-aspartyl-peptidase (threonine type)
MPIALVVHGGAWPIPDDQVAPHQQGCQAALATGWSVLESGGTALDACEAAVRHLEDDPVFNAGTGSVLNTDGDVELDAAIMDGQTLAYGAVVNLRRIRNPISLARSVLAGPATMLASEGAERFAKAQDIPLCDNKELVVERERLLWQQWKANCSASFLDLKQPSPASPSPQATGHDTVGAIALDARGSLIAANSTGGTPFKLPGRIGDTPLVGCGLYADALVGACVCTGWGEAITRMALARRAVELLEHRISPQLAAEHMVKALGRRVGGTGGCIVLSADGRVGLAWNTPRMAYAYRVEGQPMASGV